MLTTVALVAALVSSIGQAADGPSIANVRQTYFLLGPDRPDNKLLPGDSFHLAFDIDGLKVDDNGKVQYAMGLQVVNKDGKTEFGSEPTDREVYNALGGSRVPAYANVDVGINQAPGKYTVKVTVIDRATKQKAETTREFEVVNKDFGLVRASTTSDPGKLIPAGRFGVPGQSLFVNFYAVGFARDSATKQPNISVVMRVLDQSNGKATLSKPFTGDVKQLEGNESVAIPMQFMLHLNRPGKYTVELTATDNVAKKTSKLELPIVVVDAKSAP